MSEVVVQVRLIVGQLITPYGRVRTALFRHLATVHQIHPICVLFPVTVRDLILVHVERVNGNTAWIVIPHCVCILINTTHCKCTAFYKHHSRRSLLLIIVNHLETTIFGIVVFPTCSV